MMKNIFLQFTELYNVTCKCVCIVKWRISCLLCLKTKTSSCIPKKKLKLCICVWTSMTWLQALESTLPLKIASRNSGETAQLSKMFCDNALWQSNNLGIILCHQSFLLHCLCLTCWKLLPFLQSIWFYSYDFKNTEQLTTLFNSFAASRETLIIFIVLMVSPSTNWRA